MTDALTRERNPLSFCSGPPPMLSTALPGSISWSHPLLTCRNCAKACRQCNAGPFTLMLGCGPQWRKHDPPNAPVFLDVLNFGQHLVHNLEFPLPFPPQFATLIQAHHTFEHVQDLTRLLADCWRVLRYGATLEIVVPAFTSSNASGDLTHVRTFSPQTLDAVLEGHATNHPHVWPYPGFSTTRATMVTDEEIGWFLKKTEIQP